MPKPVKPLVTDLETACTLTGYSPDTLHKLLNLKRGSDDACMQALGLYLTISNKHLYEVTATSLQQAKNSSIHFIDLEKSCHESSFTIQPPYLELDALWDSEPILSGAANNILGDNGRLLLHNNEIEIPCIEAENHYLSHYGAQLLKPGDVIRFEDSIYPIWLMNINKNYIHSFLMSENGGGFYLEYHNDQPHYHHALNGEGYYLLAKWNELKTKIQMTGFKIPNGHAIYTRKGAIHCDAGLIGEYLVGYTTSQSCSTVLLRSIDPEKMVKVHFIESP